MKIALVSSANCDQNTGVSGTRIAFRDALRNLGVQADTFFMEDFKGFSGIFSNKIVFPWKVAFNRKRWEEYDIVDIASGDSWVLSSIKKRPIIVCSSHGLEHMVHRELLTEANNGNIRLSWKYPLYWGGYRLWEVSQSMKKSDFSIFLNSDDRDFAIKNIGINSSKVHIVPNGIPEYFLNRGFERNFNSNNKIKIAQVGSYIQRKGIDYTAKVMNELLKKYNNIELTFLGTGCNKEKVYENYDCSIRDRINVVPKYEHKNLPSILEGYQINLFPSLSEGFGKTLIETMACGLAPITFETPGPLDIVRNMHDAIVVPRRNTELLKKGIEMLINDKELMHKIQHNAYITAQRYSWDNAAKERINVYEKAMMVRKSSL